MDDVLWCYAVGSALALVVFTVITVLTDPNRKTAADATGLSETGHDGTQATTTTEVQQEAPKQEEAPKGDANKGDSKDGAVDLDAIAAAFDYSKNPLDMPDELVMPEFGTVRQQAAFALGGAAKQSRSDPFSFSQLCAAAATDPTKVSGDVPLAVLAGMCEPIEQNPLELLVRATYATNKESAKPALELLGKIRPEEDWQEYLKKAEQYLAICGAALDAQKLHSTFGPEGADYSEALAQLLLEEAEFEAAVKENLEELRTWLAAHTDKDEFKQPPVYLDENTDANKVDDVIPDQSNAAAKASGASDEAAAPAAAPAQP